MSNPVGRPPDEVAEAWKLRFGLTEWQHYGLTQSLMAQLSFCKSYEARRLILGVSQKETHDQYVRTARR